MNIIETVHNHVIDKYNKKTNMNWTERYDSHVKYVVEYAKELAKKLSADEEIVEIAALLHDVARIDGSNENHHIDGANYAEEYLTGLDYDPKKIAIIKNCILSHRGSVDIKRESIEAECLASADAMAHFRNISDMFYLVYHDLGKGSDEGRDMIKKKLEQSFKKMMPEAQDIVREKYEAAMKLL